MNERHAYLQTLETNAVFNEIRKLFTALDVVREAQLRLSFTTDTMLALTRTNCFGVSLFDLLAHHYPNLSIAVVRTAADSMHSIWLEVEAPNTPQRFLPNSTGGVVCAYCGYGWCEHDRHYVCP